jgi:hypothetical protein
MKTIVVIAIGITVMSEERDLLEKDPIDPLGETTTGVVIEAEALEEKIIVVVRGVEIGEILTRDLVVAEAEAVGEDDDSTMKTRI